MPKSKFGYSTVKDDRYKPKTVHPDKYETHWGTASSKESKRTWSIKHARHPVIAWLSELKSIAEIHGTRPEQERIWEALEAVNNLTDFRGVRRYDVRIAAVAFRGVATIGRLPDP